MFKTALFKPFAAGVLALGLAFSSVAATPARADLSREDAIVGLITLLFIGTAIANSDSNRNRGNDRAEDRREAWKTLPARCLVGVNTLHGEVNLFARRCLMQNYHHVNRLPARCEISVRNVRGNMRHGYEPRCLRQAGFRVEGGRRH